MKTTEKRFYTQGESFQLASTFYNEIHNACLEASDSQSAASLVYRYLRTSEITQDQDYAIYSFVEDVMGTPGAPKRWQEVISLLGLFDETEQKISLSSDDILRISYHLLEYSMQYYKNDFTPLLAMTDQILWKGKMFESARALWLDLLKRFEEEPDTVSFGRWFVENANHDWVPSPNHFFYLSAEDKMDIARCTRRYSNEVQLNFVFENATALQLSVKNCTESHFFHRFPF